MGGAVSLNQMAIHAAMSLYDIEFPQDCFEKVLLIYRHMLDKMNEKAKQNRSDNNGKASAY